ncbi:Immunity protein 30 [Paenisporosarcina quisquiliarum]|nr:Immunity protein 30 [Paenisporosarcina quisquiliarum]
MKLDYQINTLKLNRFMKTENEILLFEEALEVIGKTSDYHIIGKLIDILEDDTEHEEIMWGLVHTIEYLSEFSPKEALKSLINAIPNNIEKCREWIEILHFRILNHDEYRRLFGEALKEVDVQNQERVLNLLNDIKNEAPDKFGSKVEEIKIILYY